MDYPTLFQDLDLNHLILIDRSSIFAQSPLKLIEDHKTHLYYK